VATNKKPTAGCSEGQFGFRKIVLMDFGFGSKATGTYIKRCFIENWKTMPLSQLQIVKLKLNQYGSFAKKVSVYSNNPCMRG